MQNAHNKSATYHIGIARPVAPKAETMRCVVQRRTALERFRPTLDSLTLHYNNVLYTYLLTSVLYTYDAYLYNASIRSYQHNTNQPHEKRRAVQNCVSIELMILRLRRARLVTIKYSRNERPSHALFHSVRSRTLSSTHA